MVGESPQHDSPDRLLRRQIGIRHRVGRPFLADRKPLDPIEQRGATSPGRLFTNC